MARELSVLYGDAMQVDSVHNKPWAVLETVVLYMRMEYLMDFFRSSFKRPDVGNHRSRAPNSTAKGTVLNVLRALIISSPSFVLLFSPPLSGVIDRA